MARIKSFVAINLRLANSSWSGQLTRSLKLLLGALTNQFGFSVAHGDVLLLNRHWYVTHSGLLRLAIRKRCCGIQVVSVPQLCLPDSRRWAFKATVFKSPKCKGFVGYGDADPTNVSALVRGAEMRVAETRAVNRALRKAYGIGLCSVEEIGSASPHAEPRSHEPPKRAPKSSGNGTSSTLRDRLTLLIRQHQLDPGLVKLYASDFCGVHELRNATRELGEDFVKELATQAATDRTSLLSKLNSYAPTQEGAA